MNRVTILPALEFLSNFVRLVSLEVYEESWNIVHAFKLPWLWLSYHY